MPGLLLDCNKAAFAEPFVARKLEVCNDVEMNPGPRKNSLAPASPTKKPSVNKAQQQTSSNGNNMNSSQNSVDRELMPANDVPRIKKLGM